MTEDSSYYYGLVFGCPMREELETCAYKNIRKLSLADRIKYINSLKKYDRAVLVKKHKNCIRLRENKVPFSRIAIL